jgi:hypothetical protein
MDLDEVFGPELADLDRQQIRAWYNGYNWTGEAVYNPFDLLLLFQERQFRPYWFETGTPTFLVDLLLQRRCVRLQARGVRRRSRGCAPPPAAVHHHRTSGKAPEQGIERADPARIAPLPAGGGGQAAGPLIRSVNSRSIVIPQP